MRFLKTRQMASFLAAIMWLLAVNTAVSSSVTGDTTTTAGNKESDEIQIQADSMKLDLETGNSTYKGNVSIIQGNIKLTGEKVTITRKNNEIHNIRVEGNPARYLQDENTDNKIHASSQYMKYIAQKNRLVLTGDASLKQAEQSVASQRIVYDTQNKVIIAGKRGSPGHTRDRVSITLTPKKNTPSKTQPQGE